MQTKRPGGQGLEGLKAAGRRSQEGNADGAGQARVEC